MSEFLNLPGKPPRVVSFGGFDGNFDWDRRLASSGVAALCLKDSRRRWYLDGCDGLNESSTLQLIEEHVAGMPALFIGQSAGGYAALRYADRFKANALVFAPQTFYDAEGKTRTPEDLLDIRQQLTEQQRDTFIDIYVARSEDENPPEAYFWNDHLQIADIIGAQNVSRYVLDTDKHPCAYYLAQTGLLDWVLATSFDRVSESTRSSPVEKTIAGS